MGRGRSRGGQSITSSSRLSWRTVGKRNSHPRLRLTVLVAASESAAIQWLTMRNEFVFALTLLVLTVVTAKPDVLDSSSNGFTVKATVQIQAAPKDVYRQLIHNVGDWWNSAHTYSGDAHNLSIDEKPMGCFCEKLPNEGSVRHMEVVSLFPGKSLGMTGALGPLQMIAATGNMRVQLLASEGGTK